MATSKHWTEETFIDSPLLYLPDLLGRVERADEEAGYLSGIFDERGVPRGGLVLDLACGVGRHSVALARRGYRCVGIDISPMYVAKARESAHAAGVSGSCRFVAGDMRRLGDTLGGYDFDAAVSMYTSLGYYDVGTDVDVLSQVRRLAERGVLVVEAMNRGYGKSLSGRRCSEMEGFVRLEESIFDEESSRLRAVWRMYRPNGKALDYVGSIRFDNRLYTGDELMELAGSAGWTNRRLYGGLDGAEHGEGSKRAVLVAW